MADRLVRRVLVLGLGVLLAACGRGPAVAPPAPDGVVVGGSVTIAMARPASLDPSNVLDRAGEMVVRTMCDPLLDVDRATGELVPALVESWVVTDDGTRVVLRLREGLTFPDGTPATARDAVWSLSRAAAPDFAGENADLLAGIQGHRVLRGQEEATEPRFRREFQGLRVISDTAFEVNLVTGAQAFLGVLTHPTASILDRTAAAVDPEGFAASPTCVGPYRPSSPFDPDGDGLRLERVPTYAGVDTALAGGGQGFLEVLEFHWGEPAASGPATAPVVAPPRFDEFDVVELDPGQVAAAGAVGATVLTVPSPWVQYVGVPDVVIGAEGRRALSMAVDRRALSGPGGRAPMQGFLPPSLGSSLHRPSACGDATPVGADVAGARTVLAAAGLDLAGVTLPLVTNGDYDNVGLASEVARQWREAFPGFNPVFRQVPWEEFRSRFEDPNGFATAFRTSHHVPYASAHAWLAPLRTADIGRANGVAYGNGLFDELLDREAARTADPVDQAAVFHAAEDLLCADLPLIPLLHDQRHWAVDDALAWAGELADPVTGGLLLRNLHRP